MKPIAALACIVSVAITPAQNVSLASLVPITAQVAVNAQAQSQVVPSGAVAAGMGAGLSLQQQLATAAGSASTSLILSHETTPTGVLVELWQRATTVGAGPVSASLSTGVFVLQISNPTSVAAQLELSRVLTGSNSAAASFVVDVGNDGSVEFTDSSPSPVVSLALTIGPTPLAVRIQSQLTSSLAGTVDCQLQLLVSPTAGISTSTAVLGCDPLHIQQLLPTFAGDLQIRSFETVPIVAPEVVVLGLGLQPVLLAPLSSTSLPCLLLPSPDLVAFLPPGQTLDLPLPAAVRPISLWVQGVVWYATGLQTTNGSLVLAQ